MGFSLFDRPLHGELGNVGSHAVMSVHHEGNGCFVDDFRVRLGFDVAPFELVPVHLQPGDPVGGDPPGVGFCKHRGRDAGLVGGVAQFFKD